MRKRKDQSYKRIEANVKPNLIKRNFNSEKENQIENKNTIDKRIQFQSSTALVENSQPPTRVASNEQLHQPTRPQEDIPKGEVYFYYLYIIIDICESSFLRIWFWKSYCMECDSFCYRFL